MGRPPRATDGDATPKQFPETTPTYQQAVGAGWMTEAVMQMQASIGELKAEVKHLTISSEKQSSKLDRISHRVYAAGAVVVVLAGLASFFLSKIWDGVVILMRASGKGG